VVDTNEVAKQAMAKAFNEWMRRYIEAPEQFEAEFRAINAFLADADEGREPTYGETCAAYLWQLIAETA
jgi:hypothetical protein